MKTLYLDIFSGISGDMLIGALIDLGVDTHKLEHELEKLKLGGYHLHVARQQKSGIAGTKFDVHLAAAHTHPHDHDHGHHHHHDDEKSHHALRITHHEHEHGENRTFREIRGLIQKTRLSSWVKTKSIAVFQRVANAEGQIHGKPPEEVHFHEVGAVDSIVDIVGACVALEMLGKPRVLAAAVVEGTGWVNCAHGRFPVPTPATLAILGARKIAVTQCDEPHELVTPTGAALLAEFVETFGPMQGLVAETIGFGLGTRNNETRPNVLRAVLGKSEAKNKPSASPGGALDWETDRVAVLETNLDDMTGQMAGHFLEQAMAAGALDVFFSPIQMKKNRPGILLTVLCAEAEADRFGEMILRETTAFGVRRTVAERRKLKREFHQVGTPYGKITMKIGRLNGKAIQAAPEYETCKTAATKAKVTLKEVRKRAESAKLKR